MLIQIMISLSEVVNIEIMTFSAGDSHDASAFTTLFQIIFTLYQFGDDCFKKAIKSII